MRLLPTDDQIAMTRTVRDALGKECPPELLRASWGKTPPPNLWRRLAALGVFGVTVDELFGGLGLDERDALGPLEETGRAAVPGPIAETLAATYVLNATGAPAAVDWLPRIVDGDAMVTLGLAEEPFVVSADQADVLVMQQGSQLYVVPAAHARMERQTSIDGNRNLYTVHWSTDHATVIAAGPDADSLIAGARDRLLLAISAQLLGLARQLLDLSVRHACLREQFGRPLGTFQAVQHRLADVAVAIEFAAPVIARASCSLAATAPSAGRDAAMAKVFASEAAERAAYAALQVHGAIGYTREHDLHLYAMRAWALALAYGDSRRHRARVAADLLGAGPTLRYP
jgi:alkylation response protein AidB-like acyl-CoA dehydrogenase